MEIQSRQLLVFNNAYRQYYQLFAWRCERSVKNEVVASGMVQDAFLRLWVLRDKLSLEEIYIFLKRQIKKSLHEYFGTTKYKFERKLFYLDDYENADFLLIDKELREDGQVAEITLSLAKDERWVRFQQVLGNLNDGQKKLVGLCLKHNFDYGRIGCYLGGVSDYEVSKKVDKLLKSLQQILTDGQKLEGVLAKNCTVVKGSLDELQKQVLRMRYELSYSFAEVARALGLSEAEVKTAYAKACRVCN